MKVVLRNNVAGLGDKGDIVHVADGFARNFLIPKGQALPATPGAEAQAAAMRRSAEVKMARERERSEAVARTLVPLVVRIPAKAGAEGRLFGSVTTADLARAVADQAGVELDRRALRLDEPIKALGSHEVVVKLPGDVEFRLNVEVVGAG